MKKPNKKRPSPAEIHMQLVASGSIAAPVPHLDFALPAGFTSFRLLLRQFQMQDPPDGLEAVFSEDGVTFAGGEGEYSYQRTVAFDTVVAEAGVDSSMIVTAVSNSQPHFVDIDIEPDWAFIRSVAASHSSSGPVDERVIARLDAYNTRQSTLRIRGADDHQIIGGHWYLYGLRA